MLQIFVVLLGLIAAACAQSSSASFNGPAFDPSDAPFFGSSGLVVPTITEEVPTVTQTPTSIRTRSSSAANSSRSSSHSGSHSVTATSSKSAASSSAPPTQSTNAAVPNYQGVMGVVAGGLVAGLALV